MRRCPPTVVLAFLLGWAGVASAQTLGERLLAPDADPQAIAADVALPDADLELLAHDPDWKVRRRAEIVLLFRHDPAMVSDALVAMPESKTGDFPADCPLWSARAVAVAVERLLDPEEDPASRRALARILARGAGDWNEALLHFVTNDSDPAVRAEIVYAFQSSVPEVADPGLRQALRDPAPVVRAAALRVIGRRADGAARSADVLAGLTDADAMVRAAAARTVGWLAIDASSALEGLLGDPDPAVRYEALNALLRTAPQQAKAAAHGRALDKDTDPRVLRVAMRALAVALPIESAATPEASSAPPIP